MKNPILAGLVEPTLGQESQKLVQKQEANPVLTGLEEPKITSQVPETRVNDMDLESMRGLVEGKASEDFFDITKRSTIGQLLWAPVEGTLGTLQGIGQRNLGSWGQIPSTKLEVVDSQLKNATMALEEELKKPAKPEDLSDLSQETAGKVQYQSPERIAELQQQINQYKNEHQYFNEFTKQVQEASQSGWLKPPENQSVAWWLGNLIGQGVFSIGQAMLLSRLGVPNSVSAIITQAPEAAGSQYQNLVEQAIAKEKGLAKTEGNATDLAKLSNYFTMKDGQFKADEIQRLTLLSGLFQGVTEISPLEKMTEGVTGPLLKRFLKTGSLEALQEMASQFAQNLVDYGQMDKPSAWKLLDGLVTAGVGGLLPGGMFGALNTSKVPKKEKPTTQTAQPQEQPPALPPPLPPEGGYQYDINNQEWINNTFQQREEGRVLANTRRRKDTAGKVLPYYDPKPGVEVTPDVHAALLELSMGYTKKEAQGITDIINGIAAGQGTSLAELVKTRGIAYNQLPGFSQEPGVTTESDATLAKRMQAEAVANAMKIYAKELPDGKWGLIFPEDEKPEGAPPVVMPTKAAAEDLVRAYLQLQAEGELPKPKETATKVEKPAEPAAEPSPVAALLTGLTTSITQNDALKDTQSYSVAQDKVEGWNIVDAKGQPVKTAFETQEEAQKALTEMQAAKPEVKAVPSSMPATETQKFATEQEAKAWAGEKGTVKVTAQGWESTRPTEGENQLTLLDKKPKVTPKREDVSAGKTVGTFQHIVTTGERIISLFEGSAPGTALHEYGHLVHSLLNDEQLGVIATEFLKTKEGKALGLDHKGLLKHLFDYRATGKISDHTRATSEWLANGFVNYLHGKPAPSEGLRRVFEVMKEIITNLYLSAKRNVSVNANMQKFFDSVLLPKSEVVQGKLVVPGSQSKNGVIQSKVFDLFLQDGSVMTKVTTDQGEVPVDVDNLVMGGAPTPEQIKIFGPRVTFRSAFSLQNSEITQRVSTKGLTIRNVTEEKLQGLNEASLQALALKCGVEDVASFDREDLIDAILAARQAREGIVLDSEQAQDNVLRDEQLEDRVEIASVRKDIGQTPSKAKDNVISRPWKMWLHWTTDRVRWFGGGGPLQEHYYQLGKLVEGATYRIKGLQAPIVEALQRELGHITNVGRAELEALHQIKAGGETVAYISDVVTRLDKAARKWGDGAQLSERAQSIMTQLSKLLDLQANLAKANKMGIQLEQKDPVTGKRVKVMAPFEPKGDRFPRLYTEDFWRLIMHPDFAIRHRLAMAIAAANGYTQPTQIQAVDQWISSMKNSAEPNKRIYLEVSRNIPIMPTHIVLEGGRIVPILETTLARYVPALQMKFAQRLAFFQHFATAPLGTVQIAEGANPDFKVVSTKVLDAQVQQFDQMTKGGGPELLRMFRAANGVPTESQFRLTPDSPFYPWYSLLQGWYNIRKAFLLTTSWSWNISEPIGSTWNMVGTRAMLQAAKDVAPKVLTALPQKLTRGQRTAKFFGNTPSITDFQRLRDTVAQWGAMQDHITNWVIDPRQKWRSASKVVSDNVLKYTGVSGIASFNEFFAALATQHFLDRISVGKGTETDLFRLRMLGFTPSQIEELCNSTASPELRQMVVTRMVPYTQATNTIPLTKSEAGNSKGYQDLMWFDSYGRNRIKHLATLTRQFYMDRKATPEAWYKSGKTLAAAIVGAETMVGTTISGALGTALLTGLMFGIKSALWYDWDRDEKDELSLPKEWSKFVTNAMLQGLVSGPMASMMRSVKQGETNLLHAMADTIGPANVLMNDFAFLAAMSEATAGAASKGATDKFFPWSGHITTFGYGGLNPFDTALAYMNRNVPIINKSLAFLATAYAFGRPDAKLAFAKKQYYQFLDSPGRNFERADNQWHRDLMSAVKIIETMDKHFDDQGQLNFEGANGIKYHRIDTYMRDALDVLIREGETDANEKLAAAIDGKRMLSRIPVKDRERFKRMVKPEIYQRLEEYDTILTQWARRVRYEF